MPGDGDGEPRADYRLDEREDGGFARLKRLARRALVLLGIGVLVLFGVALLVQGVSYSIGAYGCSAPAFRNYSYPYGAEMVPNDVTMVADHHMLWRGFLVQETDKDGIKHGAAVGYFFQIWGPFSYITGYRDPYGHTLFLSTSSAIRLGFSEHIYRCDGKGDTFTVSEGTKWFTNRIRRLLGYFAASEYSIYDGSELIAQSDKIGYGAKTLNFHEVNSEKTLADATLSNRDGVHEWIVHNIKREGAPELPDYVTTTLAALMAFHHDAKIKTPSTAAPKALAAEEPSTAELAEKKVAEKKFAAAAATAPSGRAKESVPPADAGANGPDTTVRTAEMV